MDWFHFKLLVVAVTGLNRDALHVLTGFASVLVVAVMLRRSLASPLPWLILAIAACLNEYYDLRYERWPDLWQQYAASGQDLLTTMLIPTILLLLARFAPGLLVPPKRNEAE